MEGLLWHQKKGDQPIENQLSACQENLTSKHVKAPGET